MGEVYKARDTRLDRIVAIKVLPSDRVADLERKRRFVQEAKAASALNHPSIVTVHDFGSEDGIDYMVMEWVDGRTLAALIAAKHLNLPDVLKYATQVADALAKAHSANIIHRDLKPSNIMVSENGLAKVLDFGVAKLSERSEVGKDDTTATLYLDTGMGTVVGTPAYMSPEQAEGKPVDVRSDIFSFGSVLYEMVTGRQPFRGVSNMSTMAAIMKGKARPVRELVPETPAELERIIDRCLQKLPARRVQHMDDLRVVLEELCEESEPRGAAGLAANTNSHWILIALVISILVFAVMMVGLYRESRLKQKLKPAAGPTVVVLMDTSAPIGVYDPNTRKNSGTNADDLSEILRDLPVVLHKETVGSTWDREDQVLKQSPDLIMIHRFCFFHAINLEFHLGYPPFGDSEEVRLPTGERVSREYLFYRLGALAENKLLAFLGYVGVTNRRTQVLVYSRGEGNGWSEADRQDWVGNLERRFPSLKGRVFAMGVDGARPTFRDPQTALLVKRRVQSILALTPSSSAAVAR